MDLAIEHVEHLTLNFTPNSRPSLVDLIARPASMPRVKSDIDECHCVFCTLRRDVSRVNEISRTPATAANLKIPALGAVWPGQGGINAGLRRGVEGQPDYYQIVGIGAAAAVEKIRWAGDKLDSQSTDATSLDDGWSNTQLLAESRLDFPAAKWARGLVIDGHSDYYLPSLRDLALCFANVPEVFDKGAHWTSTQYSHLSAWSQGFVGGHQDGYIKSAELRARAVRRFIA